MSQQSTKEVARLTTVPGVSEKWTSAYTPSAVETMDSATGTIQAHSNHRRTQPVSASERWSQRLQVRMKVVPVLYIFLARTVLVGEAELHAERHNGKEANTHDVVSEPVIILSRCSGVGRTTTSTSAAMSITVISATVVPSSTGLRSKVIQQSFDSNFSSDEKNPRHKASGVVLPNTAPPRVEL